MFAIVAPLILASTLVKNVTVFDGMGAQPYGPTDILVVDGTIASIAPNLVPPTADTVSIDLSGSFAIPGLVDAHAHLASVPGARFRSDSTEKIADLRRRQLRAYLVAGVTTVLDPAIPESVLQELQRHVRESGNGPEILALSPVIVPIGGYIASENFRRGLYEDLDRPVERQEDILFYLEKAKRIGSAGVKVAIEPGFGPFASYTILSPEDRLFLAKEAQRLGVPVFVHSMTNDRHEIALDMRPRALVHAGYFDESPDDKTIRRMVDQGTFVVTTVAIQDMMMLQWWKEGLADPRLRRLVPHEQLETFEDQRVLDFVTLEVAKESTPAWVPHWILEAFAPFVFKRSVYETFLANCKAAIKQLHAAKVRLVMGSDAGNWPAFATFFHGYGSIREMELLIEAGIPPVDVIKMATSEAAAMLELADRGRLAPGMRGDIVFLSRNPLVDKDAFRTVLSVMKHGKLSRVEDVLSGI